MGRPSRCAAAGAVALMLAACAAPAPPLPVPDPPDPSQAGPDGTAVAVAPRVGIPPLVPDHPPPDRPALLAACLAARDAPTAGRAADRTAMRASAVIARPVAGLAEPVRIDILPSHQPPVRGDCHCLIDLALRIFDKPGLRLLARGFRAMTDPRQPITNERAELLGAGVGPGSYRRLNVYVDRVRTGCAAGGLGGAGP